MKPIMEAEEMELVDIEYKSGPKGVLRIFIDKAGGVNISDCEEISSKVGAFLDLEDIIGSQYVLEVSSPGLDRPLKNEADYRRNKGKRVKIYIDGLLKGKKTLIGQIISASDQKVNLKEKSGKIINVPIADIAKGILEIDF
ncbi:MAG: ribosome maturation factor RimP [Nitrospinota bacterium]|nr:ribosome maturation factor RimP [Nitrospinota bacterium]